MKTKISPSTNSYFNIINQAFNLLLQLLTFSICIHCKTKQTKLFADFQNLIIHKPSLGSSEVPQKNLGRIGSAVLTFIGYKHTDMQKCF